MKFSDILLTVVVFIIFALLHAFPVVTAGIQNLKDNWTKYRCVPSYMPFASYLGKDPVENFTYCVGNIQKDLMGYFLDPIQYILGNLGATAKFVLDRIQFIRMFVDKLRNLLTSLLGDVYGMFVNILIQFQKLMIKLKDTLFKVTGIMAVQIYLVEGAMKTGQSIDRGPIGSVLRLLCFSPSTPLILKNGQKVLMKDINLGDILENGSEVYGKLDLKGSKTNPFYSLWSSRLQSNIYVTGSHKIFNNRNENPSKLENYIEVKDHVDAKKTNYYSDKMSCLITSNHNIPIGEYTFWDWED